MQKTKLWLYICNVYILLNYMPCPNTLIQAAADVKLVTFTHDLIPLNTVFYGHYIFYFPSEKDGRKEEKEKLLRHVGI